MANDLDAVEVAAALLVSVGTLVRQLRRIPIDGEITAPEIAALGRIERMGCATPSDLARAERITPQAMGTTVNSLEQRGLVQRQSDPRDGRRIVLSLTEAGLRMTRNKRTARTERLAKVLSHGFSAEELAVLAAAAPLIGRLSENMA